MYKEIASVLVKQMRDWLHCEVHPQNNIKNGVKYPYITYFFDVDWSQYEFDMDSPNFNIHVQLKVISDDQVQQKDLKFKLKRIFIMEKVRTALANSGISLLNIEDLYSPATNLENFVQYDDGWEMTFNIHYDEPDFTIGDTQMDTVNNNFKED